MAIVLPGLDEPGKPGLLRTRWFPMVLTEAATFLVIMLLAASHLVLLHDLKSHGPILLQMKSNAIAAVRNALAADGPTDQLIGAVVKMASYEAMFGDQKSFELHMAGLIKMIEMRGGLSSLGLNGMLARMCVWVDRNSAMLLNTPLHLTSVPKDLSVGIDPSGFLAMR
jgi:Fungal specific transcription factor domain